MGLRPDAKGLRALLSIERSAARIQAKGINPDPQVFWDILLKAKDALEEAETDEKRRLIENLIVNTAASEEQSARTEALHALAIVAGMPPLCGTPLRGPTGGAPAASPPSPARLIRDHGQ